MVFRNEDAFGGADHPQRVGIHLADKQRRAVAHDVVVVRPAPRVHKKQPAAHGDPVLLRVVAAEDFTVVEFPFANRLETDAVLAPRDVGRTVRAQCQEIAALELRE